MNDREQLQQIINVYDEINIFRDLWKLTEDEHDRYLKLDREIDKARKLLNPRWGTIEYRRELLSKVGKRS